MFDPAAIREDAFARYRALAVVRAYTDSHPTAALTLAQAASIACLERKYFSTFFHARVGVRFKAWETYRRIQGARALVAHTDRSITTIASEWGFSDLRTFERAFRRCYSMTPQELRRATTLACHPSPAR